MSGLSTQINFDEDKHLYSVNGLRVPSVTEVLSSVGLPDLSMVNKSILEWKAGLGKAVHKATELLDQDDLDEDSIDERIIPYIAAYKQFKTEFKFAVMEIELRTFHPVYGYAGTFDRLGNDENGNIWLVDFKTGTCEPKTVGPQTAAYVEAFKEFNCPAYKKIKIHRAALKLNDDGTYKFKPLTNKMDFQIFLNALNIYKWRVSK